VRQEAAHIVPSHVQPMARARPVLATGLKGSVDATLCAERVEKAANKIAHDFNNQLQVVNGYIELAMSFTQDAKVRRYLQIASDGAKSNIDLMSKLRDIAATDESDCL
jgi:signal transduction histidine kinase